MANLGSEFIRAFNAYEKKDMLTCKDSSERCFAMIEILMSMPEMKNRQTEICLSKNILNIFLDNNPENYFVTKRHIQSYFEPFALKILI